MENEEITDIKELRNRYEMNPLNKPCPICGKFPLEEQTFGYEKSIFCSGCDYQQIKEIENSIYD